MRNYQEWKKTEQEKPVALDEFLKKRLEGAKKIANKAEEKGGVAILTAWHFKAKLPLYKQLTKQVENSSVEETVKRRFEAAKKQLSLQLTQREFQELMGELEVLGEVYLQIKHPTPAEG